MKRKYIQVDLFDNQSYELKLENGRIIDSRQIEGIDLHRYYKIKEVAAIMDCSNTLVNNLCIRTHDKSKKQIDERLLQGIDTQRKYTHAWVARRFNCSASYIRYIAYIGYFQRSPKRNTFVIPGWSLTDFIKQRASNTPTPPHQKSLDYIAIGEKSIRIPGWAIAQYIENSCSHF